MHMITPPQTAFHIVAGLIATFFEDKVALAGLGLLAVLMIAHNFFDQRKRHHKDLIEALKRARRAISARRRAPNSLQLFSDPPPVIAARRRGAVLQHPSWAGMHVGSFPIALAA